MDKETEVSETRQQRLVRAVFMSFPAILIYSLPLSVQSSESVSLSHHLQIPGINVPSALGKSMQHIVFGNSRHID